MLLARKHHHIYTYCTSNDYTYNYVHHTNSTLNSVVWTEIIIDVNSRRFCALEQEKTWTAYYTRSYTRQTDPEVGGRQQIQKKHLKLVFNEYYPLFDKIQHNSYLSGGHTLSKGTWWSQRIRSRNVKEIVSKN